jgi:hypothetical protein
MIILRGVVGLIIGIGYGLLIGALVFLFCRIVSDPAHPGPMIPNENEWGRLLVTMATVSASIGGALVGLIVSLSAASKMRGTAIGFIAGLGILVYWFWGSWTRVDLSLFGLLFILLILTVCFLLFPIGLAVTGALVSHVCERLSRTA